MKKILLILSLMISISYAATAEQFYKDMKLYIEYEEEKIYLNDQQEQRLNYSKGFLYALLSYNMLESQIGATGLGKKPLICLEDAAEYELAKMFVKTVDDNPKLLRKKDLSVIFTTLLENYKCKQQ